MPLHRERFCSACVDRSKAPRISQAIYGPLSRCWSPSCPQRTSQGVGGSVLCVAALHCPDSNDPDTCCSQQQWRSLRIASILRSRPGNIGCSSRQDVHRHHRYQLAYCRHACSRPAPARYLPLSGGPPPASRVPLLWLPKMLPMTPDARAGLRLDSARVAKLVLPWRARMRDALAAAAAAGGLLAGPWLDAGGVPKGVGVSPPLSRCSAAGERQPSATALESSVSRIECIAGLMLLGRACTRPRVQVMMLRSFATNAAHCAHVFRAQLSAGTSRWQP